MICAIQTSLPVFFNLPRHHLPNLSHCYSPCYSPARIPTTTNNSTISVRQFFCNPIRLMTIQYPNMTLLVSGVGVGDFLRRRIFGFQPLVYIYSYGSFFAQRFFLLGYCQLLLRFMSVLLYHVILPTHSHVSVFMHSYLSREAGGGVRQL